MALRRDLLISAVAAGLASLGVMAQAQQASMTFFVTSAGPGKGAELGGLNGADAHCQQLAQAAGAGAKRRRNASPPVFISGRSYDRSSLDHGNSADGKSAA